MKKDNTLDFPQTAQSLARHTAQGHPIKTEADLAVEYIAKAQGALPFQVKGDKEDAHMSDAEVVKLAKDVKILGMDVRQWNTYSHYDYNPIKELAMMVYATFKQRNNKRSGHSPIVAP